MPAFLLPDLGEGLTEAEVVTWHVKVGDTVTTDQNVVEVETAKAMVEVPVPFAGRVTELHALPGDVVSVGQPLVTVEAAPTAVSRPGLAEPGVVAPGDAARDEGGSGQVLIGSGTPAARPRRRRGAIPPAVPPPVPPPAVPPSVPPPASRLAVASPLLRRLARDAGVDLTAIRGSGRDGLITRRDVDAAIKAKSAAQVPAGLTRIPLKGLRKAAADKFVRSRREIPEATVWVDADATETVRLRAELNADASAPKISLLALVSRFAILGLRRYPELNARVEGDEIVLRQTVNLGFAAQTERGLIVPVLRDAQALTLEQLSSELSQRSARARSGDLELADLAGGTFTVNNYGVFGVDGSAAIINHPEAAMLGVGRVIERPWVVGGAVVPRHVTELTLVFDHRVCDGGTAGGFLRFVADCIESPATLLRQF
jgi:2-oxoisovalerate dehydrogenase E2 component (dihydrolipoyl transacylase)